MSTIATTAVYEDGVIRPLEKLDLPERQELFIFILPIREQERQETLADVLGFDPTDEEKLMALAESQYQAVMQLAGGGRSGRSSVAEDHDEYLYGDPHQ
jgi:predicted DNA-binding antitoxin AbrB/MazE fold protein